MSIQLKRPIRTYERKKVKEVTVPVPKLIIQTLSNDNKIHVSLSKKLNKTGKDIDTSVYNDRFETTFDRLLKNVRIPPKTLETHNDTVLLNSTDSRSDTNDISSVHELYSFRMPISKKKTRRKLKVQVVKKTIIKKTTSVIQNNGKFKVLKDDSHNKYKLRSRGNNSNIIFNILGIDSLSFNSEGEVLDAKKYNKLKRKTSNKNNVGRKRKKDNTMINIASSNNNNEIKQCFVKLDQLPNQQKIIESSTNNLEHIDGSVKYCFVKLEQLEMDSYNIRKRYENVVSSTPIGRPVKLATQSISLSPIPIGHIEKLKGSMMYADNISIKENNEGSSEIKHINIDLCERLDAIEKCKFEEKSKLLLEDADKENIDSLTIYNCDGSDNYTKKKLFSERDSTENIAESKTEQNDMLGKSVLMQEHVILGTNKKKLLRFSIDENRSCSLFDTTNEIIQTLSHAATEVNVSAKVFTSNLVLDDKNRVLNNETSSDFIQISENLDLNMNSEKKTYEKIQEKLPESSIITTLTSDVTSAQVELKLKLQTVSDENKDMADVAKKCLSSKNHTLDVEDSFMDNCKKYSIPSSYVALKQLQDPIRITKRREYNKWNFDLDIISEDDNNSTALKEKQTCSEKLTKVRQTMLQKYLPPLENIIEQSINHVSIVPEKLVYLKPGKSWARSLTILHSIQTEFDLDVLSVGKGKNWRNSVQDILNMQRQSDCKGIIQSCIKKNDSDNELQISNEIINKSEHELANNKSRTHDSINLGRVSRRISVRVVPIQKTVKSIEDAPFLEVYGIVPIKSQRFTLLNNPRKSSTCNIQTNDDSQITEGHVISTAREVILQRCLQTDYISFSTYFTDSYLEYCRKIGEGVYGEVFLYEEENKKSVIKIIPIEGSEFVNGEPQKKFHEILSEIVIAMELYNLRFNTRYNTDGFVEVKNIKCIKGKYPEKLTELWNTYDEEKRSDNDCPSMFHDDQLYIVLELGHGGQDLEAFVFNTADEAHILFIQAALALAVAEKAVEFEHRDLHWGNMLISSTNESYIHYKLGQKNIELISKGVKVSIIDFTLSRVKYQGCSIFNDLESDPALFTAQGEYQFEIYRLMRDKVMKNWQKFEPYTNILWLHYTLDKMITGVRYRKRNLKIHKNGITKLKELKNEILSYNSTYDFVINCDKVSSLLHTT